MNITNLFDKFFTPAMGGLRLGFSAEERGLAETVHSIAFAEIQRHPNSPEVEPVGGSEGDEFTDERIELSKMNLIRIFELLEKARDAREEFLENFTDWSVLRRDAIQKLTEIEQTIQKEKFWCNVGKMAGHVIGGAGAIAIASVFLFPPVAPVAALPACLSGIAPFIPGFLLPAAPAVISPLVVNGGIAAGVGGVSSLGSKVAELALLHQRMEAAKKVLQGDKRTFAYMENWFKHTEELIDAVEDVIGFDVVKQLYEDMDTLFAGIKGLHDLKHKSPQWLKAAVRFCVRHMLTGELFTKYLEPGLSAVIVTFMFVVVFLSRRNRFILKCILKTKELMNRFHIDIDAVSELARVFAAVSVGGTSALEYLPTEAARELTLGMFAGLGIAINAASVVLTSIDIKNGSTCKQREEIKKAAEKLQEELGLLERVYNAMYSEEAQNCPPSHSEIQDSDDSDFFENFYDAEGTTNVSLVSEAQDSEETSHNGKSQEAVDFSQKLYTSIASDKEHSDSESETLDCENISLASEAQDSEENSHNEKLQEVDLLQKFCTSIDSAEKQSYSESETLDSENISLVSEARDSEETSHNEKLQEAVDLSQKIRE